ncbi:uncharacterized protein [Procambarus clarkii]|uniref:uncharacterized protein n=1 Tax=Procambarus clarkii TaxID=6728 RepID=UPI001E675D17|nr:uncharacterized protein LOC123763995 [Procambarus clarkii]XP_045607374.1 uncharacterized protein LOC123763995 [Procambarus clarkii]XP_045607375.1 uncharacterized protein LOC123763995 [Procambarus clarkii]XP_045607376.1 uncharacterized protein LOC123763995 [Procambarus clarkii]XP_045607377.1 uncharacterized protein LOC123763995 [Procambarus clarkii]XP_045607378.1 uncharacterized protein LOC123763995 [Procambarus clarkii]
MEHLEVMPVSCRVVCLNAPHLKSLCVFEALSRTLGCYYNHHRPQIVSCQGMVRLPVPRIVRIRGHASHTHTPGETPTLHTTLQMGTYLVFHLTDWAHVRKCYLVLNGIEKVPRTNVPPRIVLERIHGSDATQSQLSFKDVTHTNENTRNNVSLTRTHTSPLPGTCITMTRDSPTCLPSSAKLSSRRRDLSHCNKDNKGNIQVNNSVHLVNDQSKQDIEGNGSEGHQENQHNQIILNMDQTEEVTSLLDEDEDEDEYTSDTSDDLHKVVRKRLSVDITPLLNPHPNDKILVLLLRPAEETQAWQFLSSCIKVTHSSSNTMVLDGSGTIKKALTRTKPLYFSKNGHVHRI